MGHTLLGGGSPLNKFKEIEAHLSRNSRTVYVELDGDDVKGDGSIGKPFKTIGKAISLAVGTTKFLTVSLGDGVHSCGAVVVLFAYIKFEGTGSIEISQESGVLFSAQASGAIFIGVDVVDVSASRYTAAFNMSGDGLILVRSGAVVEISKAINMAYSGHGHNSLYVAVASIVSTVAIPKIGVSVNSEPLSLTEISATYTNIN